MTAGSPFERLVEDWLATAAPPSIPGQLHRMIVDRARRTRQRRGLRSVPALRGLPPGARLAIDLVAAVIIAAAVLDAVAPRGPASGAGGLPAGATPFPTPQPTGTAGWLPELADLEFDYTGRARLTADGIALSIEADAAGWEPYDGFSISKSFVGPQGAEAVVFWAGFPGGEQATECLTNDGPVRESALAVVDEIAASEGVEVVTAPVAATVGGRPAAYVAVTIRSDVGCDPGFFYSWKAKTAGALWIETGPGDEVRAWAVDVEGGVLFVGALINGATPASLLPDVQDEIDGIVASIRFE